MSNRVGDSLISVVLPAFNAESTLNEAVTSILKQTYSKFELITVDDGSTDSSADVLADLARNDRRVRVIRTRNRGVATALNTGIAAAKGEFIARMDADDVSEPTRFEKQANHLTQYEACIAVGCRMTLIDGNNIPLRKQHRIHGAIQIFEAGKSFRNFPPSPPAIPHPTAMLRSAAIKAIGGYRSSFPLAQDRDLWWRLGTLGEIHCLPDRLHRYRVHDKSATTKYREQSAANALIADLSAIARHFALDDCRLLEDYKSTREPFATIQGYVELIGEHFPASELVNYRAISTCYPSLAGYQDRSSALRFSISQFLQNPFSKKRRRLVSNSFLRT